MGQWNTKTSTLLASVMIAEAVAVELLAAHLKPLGDGERKAAEDRIRATLARSMKEFLDTTTPSIEPGHRMIAADLKSCAEPMLKALLDLATADD